MLFWFAWGVALGCLIIGGWMLIWCSLLTMSGLLFVGCEFDFWSGFGCDCLRCVGERLLLAS